MSKNIVVFLGFSLLLLLPYVTSAVDYRAALAKSLIFFEAQRSGPLPRNQRVQWRANSGLKDGSDRGVNLEGGYYDAGDNVKFGFPMAYSITMLSWSVVEFRSHLNAQKELQHALEAIKWGTDYLLRAHTRPNTLYGQVGEGNSDHDCWQRPEDMTTPRSLFYIDEQHPGADLAAETAAALAAASIAFQSSKAYSAELLKHSRQLFDFARNHPGRYQNSIPASPFYASSGYEDELLWAAAWLHRASRDQQYCDYIYKARYSTGGVLSMFSWDNKYIGAQTLIAREVLQGSLPQGDFKEFKNNAEQFICNCVGKGYNNIKRTNGGLLWFDSPWSSLQYVNSASFVISAYADYLSSARTSLICPSGSVSPANLINFVKSQMNYILGENPKRMSYMVGYGSNHPQKVHHRGASIVSIKKDKTFVSCKGGYDTWFNRNNVNPNVLEGAIVGGPDQGDNYLDSRGNFQQAEPSTGNNAPIVGVLARIAGA